MLCNTSLALNFNILYRPAMQFFYNIFHGVYLRLLLTGLVFTVSACAITDVQQHHNDTEITKVLPPKKISQKNDHALHNLQHQSRKNILVTNLNTDDHNIGSNKISKIEFICSAQLQCVKLIQNKIMSFWDYPKSYPKFKTILVLELNRDGYITIIRLKRSSGRRDFDDSVIKAVRQAAPFTEITHLPELTLSEFSSIEMVFKR